MATYVIGDIQGCYTAFRRLLDKIALDPGRDRLWLVGDLVNRGGASLQVLRLVHSLRAQVTCVLGNHDLHYLHQARQAQRKAANPELDAILAAEDGALLLEWLRGLPLIHIDADRRLILVHAGISPDWTLELLEKLNNKVTTALRGPHYDQLMQTMHGNRPAIWSPGLEQHEQWRAIINITTRMRFRRANGSVDFSTKGPPESGKPGTRPWYEFPRIISDYTILFGHWSALGLYFGHQAMCLDSGCVWGNKLTAIGLGRYFGVWQVDGRRG